MSLSEFESIVIRVTGNRELFVMTWCDKEKQQTTIAVMAQWHGVATVWDNDPYFVLEVK